MANFVGTLHTFQFTSEELHLIVKALDDHSRSPENDYGHDVDPDVGALINALQEPIWADYEVKSLKRDVEYKKHKVAALEKAFAELRATSGELIR